MGTRKREPGIRPICENEWRVVARIRVNGKIVQRRQTLKGTKEKAREILAGFKREIREGHAESSLTSTELRTFGELLKIYKDKREQCSTSHLNKVKLIERELGAIDLPCFPDRFERYLQILKTTNSKETGKPRSNSCINRLIEIVRAAFNIGVSLGLLETNPISKVRFPRLKELPRDVVLSDMDKQRLLNVIDREAPHLSAIVRFSLQVPCRKSELAKMKKEDLDLIHNAIRVKAGNSKNDIGCWKPIPPNMVAYFRSLPNETDFLFYRKVEYKKTGESKYFGLGSFHSAWSRCLKLAGLMGFHFHDTRHMSATALIDNGTPEQTVLTVANWKTNMLRNYYHREPKKALELVRFGGDCEATVKPRKVSAL